MTEELQIDYTELQHTVKKLLPDEMPITFEELLTGMMRGEYGSISGIVTELLVWLKEYIAFPVEHGLRLLFLILFSALFSNLSKAFSKEGTSHVGFLCVYLLMAVHATTGFAASLQIATEGMENLCDFVGVLLPMYCVSIAAVTGTVTATGYYQGTAFLLSFFEFLTRFCLLPLTQAYLLISFASCMQKKPVFKRLLGLMVSLFSWIKKTLLGIALAFGAVQGILAPAIDSVKRTVVLRSASAIPGVGEFIGGAWETVLGTGVVLKNALGLAGVIFLLLVVAVPLFRLLFQYWMYRVLSAVTEPVALEMAEQFLHHVGTAQRLLLETLVLGVLLFLLLLVIMTRITA